jgi:hypothetical protein
MKLATQEENRLVRRRSFAAMMRGPSPLETVLHWLLAAAAAGIVLFTCAAIVHGYSPTPFADSWNPLMSYRDFGYRVTLESLTMFHNEHRPFFARVPILIDLFWLEGRGFLPLALIFLTQAAEVWLLFTIARKQTWFDPSRHGVLLFTLAVFCCFSPAQLENFLWTFQTAFVQASLFGVGALAAVAVQKEHPSWKWPALVAFCAIGATFCLASGVLVWWVVVLMAIALRLRWRWVLVYLAAAIVTPPLYFIGYHRPPAHMDPLAALRKPLEVAHYVAIYFGYSWRMWASGFGELLVLIVLALLAARVLKLIREAPANPWEVVPPAILVLLLGTAILTALGRLNFGLEQAGSGRYQTPALIFWFAAALLVARAIAHRGARLHIAFAAFLLAAMLTPFGAMRWTFERVEEHRVQQNRSGMAWVSGVEDQQVMPRIVDIMPLVEVFRARHLSVFGIPPGSEVGSRLKPERILPGNACEGIFHRESFVDSRDWPGIRLEGEAYSGVDDTRITRFIATRPDLQIIGAGVGDRLYASAKSFTEPILVYGLLSDGKACSILLQ